MGALNPNEPLNPVWGSKPQSLKPGLGLRVGGFGVKASGCSLRRARNTTPKGFLLFFSKLLWGFPALRFLVILGVCREVSTFRKCLYRDV